MSALPAPHERVSVVGRAAPEALLRAMIEKETLVNGWMICAARGAGKATLAYRLAKALLDPDALSGPETLDMPADARTFRLVAGRAHPDLFVAERLYDEKTGRYASDITVETIRKMSGFLSRTASQGGWRVAILDCADDLNRNAANALLKSLEEPPPRTAILLVANAPGRLLATIRSRCRRIDLRPLGDREVAALLAEELGLGADESARVAAAAHGLPGYALTLAAGEGVEAVKLADDFLRATCAGDNVARIAAAFSGRQNAGSWEIFKRLILDAISDAARAEASGQTPRGPLTGAPAAALLEAFETIEALLRRGEAVNVDRSQLVFSIGRTLSGAVRAQVA